MEYRFMFNGLWNSDFNKLGFRIRATYNNGLKFKYYPTQNTINLMKGGIKK